VIVNYTWSHQPKNIILVAITAKFEKICVPPVYWFSLVSEAMPIGDTIVLGLASMVSQEEVVS